MARTTPAQNPRGEHSSTLRAGFSEVFITMSKKSRSKQSWFKKSRYKKTRRFPANFSSRHGLPRPTLSRRHGCTGPTQSLYSGNFPIIIDDLVLRPAGGRSVEEICHGHTSTVDAEGDRRLAVGQYRAGVRPDRRILQAAPARDQSDRRRRLRAGH